MRTYAVLTGHTRGLGAAVLTELLADPGCLVLGLARTSAPPHPRLVQRIVDLTDPAAAAAALGDALAGVDWRDVDRALLVNNAGTLGPMAPVGRIDAPATVAAVSVDLTSAVLLTDAFLRATDASRAERRILQVSSGAARRAYSGWGVYCAAKAALDQFTRVLAEESPPRCRVASVAPGVIDTDMQREIRAADPADFPQRDRFVGLHRDGALVTPRDAAARLVGHLLGDTFGDEVVVDLRG